jgi:hypothetical protein
MAACPICQTEVDWAVYPGARWTSTCPKCGYIHTVQGGEVWLTPGAPKQTFVPPIIRFKCMACRSTDGLLKVDEFTAVPWVLQAYGSAWLHPHDHLRQPALCAFCREAWAAQEPKNGPEATATLAAEPEEGPCGASASALWLAQPREGPQGSTGASASALLLTEPNEGSARANTSEELKEHKWTPASSSTWTASPRLRKFSQALRSNKVDGTWQ